MYLNSFTDYMYIKSTRKRTNVCKANTSPPLEDMITKTIFRFDKRINHDVLCNSLNYYYDFHSYGIVSYRLVQPKCIHLFFIDKPSTILFFFFFFCRIREDMVRIDVDTMYNHIQPSRISQMKGCVCAFSCHFDFS